MIRHAAQRERGIELGYAEITANVNTTSTTAVDIAGLEVTVEVRDRPILLRFGCRAVANNTSNGNVVIGIHDDANNVVQWGDMINHPVNARRALMIARRLAPAPGSHTYKMRWLVSSGTGSLLAGTDHPAFLQAVEI